MKMKELPTGSGQIGRRKMSEYFVDVDEIVTVTYRVKADSPERAIEEAKNKGAAMCWNTEFKRTLDESWKATEAVPE